MVGGSERERPLGSGGRVGERGCKRVGPGQEEKKRGKRYPRGIQESTPCEGVTSRWRRRTDKREKNWYAMKRGLSQGARQLMGKKGGARTEKMATLENKSRAVAD